jgi:hypothetical protein
MVHSSKTKTDPAADFLMFFKESKNIDGFKHLVENIDDYLKALYLELRSIEKYLNVFITHKKFRNLQEFLSLHDLLENRLKLLIQTMLKFSQTLQQLNNLYHQLIETVSKTEMENKIQKKLGIKVSNLFSFFEIFKDIKLEPLFSEFNYTRHIFVKMLENVINMLKKKDVSIDQMKLKYYLFPNNIKRRLQESNSLQDINDDVIVLPAVAFSHATKNLWMKIRKLKNLEHGLKIHHLHSYPDKFSDRRYILHIVGGLGSFAGRQALQRFLTAIPNAWQDGLSDTEIFQKIESSEHTVKNKESDQIVFAEFSLQIHGKTFQVVFTNDESKIPPRRRYFDLFQLFERKLHYGKFDYVYFLKNLITQHNASLVYIICNTASAPKELERLSHLTHSFIYDLPMGFVEELKSTSNFGVIFLSTVQLYGLKTYQLHSKGFLWVYESNCEFFNGLEKISDNTFYERLTNEITNRIQTAPELSDKFKLEIAVNFLDLLNYINIPENRYVRLNEAPFIIGLCCTEFPLAKHWLMDNLEKLKVHPTQMLKVYETEEAKKDPRTESFKKMYLKKLQLIEGIETGKIIFKDPLDTGNENIKKYLDYTKDESILTKDGPVGGPHNYDQRDHIPHE